MAESKILLNGSIMLYLHHFVIFFNKKIANYTLRTMYLAIIIQNLLVYYLLLKKLLKTQRFFRISPLKETTNLDASFMGQMKFCETD